MTLSNYSLYRIKFAQRIIPMAVAGHAAIIILLLLGIHLYSPDKIQIDAIIWGSVFTLVLGYRLWTAQYFNKLILRTPKSASQQLQKKWVNHFVFTTFLNGLCWGSSVIFLENFPSYALFFLISVPVIITAVSIGSLGIIPEAYYAFAIPTNLPFVVWLLLHQQPLYLIFAIGIVVGLSYTYISIRHLRLILEDSENTQSSLKKQSHLLTTIMDKNPAIIIVKDLADRFVLGNQALANLYNTTTANLVGKSDRDFNLNTQQTDSYAKSTKNVILSKKIHHINESSTNALTGKIHYYQSVKIPLLDDASSPKLLIIATDITEFTEAQRLASSNEKRYRYAIEATDEGLWDWNMVNNQVSHNTQWCQLLGLDESYHTHDVDTFLKLLHKDDKDNVLERVNKSIEENISYYSEHRIQHPAKGYIWVEDRGKVVEWDETGHPTRMVGSIKDISKRKLANEEELYRLAQFDSLTGLPNRSSFQNLLERLIKISERNRQRLALFFIDLDRFKQINDSLGHAIGDQVLIAASQRLNKELRSSDTLCRLGGDEFVLIVNNLIGESGNVSQIARKLLTALDPAIEIEGYSLHCSASIGIALYPDNGDTVQTLMKSADTAMYQVKNAGRNSFIFFTDEMNTQVHERLTIENDLRTAINNDEFFLEYQPQFTINTQKIVSCEALLRWRHPTRGLIPPTTFIPIAEESGLIIPIGEWVIQEALETLSELDNLQLSPIGVAINLSAHQLKSSELIPFIKQRISASNVQANLLELELTETATMENPEQAIKKLTAFKSIGLKLALDDFGTGYSSLNYLKTMPFDRLKIDQTFVRDIETDKNDAQICLATINLAHSLGLQVVGEGIETEGQLKYLKENGCDLGQGALVSHSVSKQKLFNMLENK